MRFGRFVAIDWSGAAGLRHKGIAVATCEAGDESPVLVRPGHRWSRQEIVDWTLEAVAEPATLIGFDLSPALPFADCASFFPGWSESPDNARDLWALVERVCEDDFGLGASSFVDHEQASRHFRRHGGRRGDCFPAGPGRMRVVEIASRDQRVANPYSCFNLVGAAQVGKSSLTGMRAFLRLNDHVPIWPFDAVPESGSLLVEIYTSVAAIAAGLPRGRTKIRDSDTLDHALARLLSRPHKPLSNYNDHATDAILTAAWLRKVSGNEALWHPALLTAEIARTEGWTFGIG